MTVTEREVLVLRLQRRKCILTEWYDTEETDDIASIDTHWFNGRRYEYKRPYGVTSDGCARIHFADLAKLSALVGTVGTWESPSKDR